MKTPEPTSSRCPECGADIPSGQPKGLCFTCALRGAIELTPDPHPASGHPLPSDGRGAGGEGRQFGDYELLEEIARGGMGIVFRARQKSLDRVVAVKLLLLGQYASEEFIHRFRIEASAAASLQHPNIVAIHEVGVHQDQHYFAMDFVDGPNFAELVRDQPLTARRAAGYVKTIAEAIHFAHTRRILHRDLKPSNVLIDSNDQPRVTDFGLAKKLSDDSDLTLTGQVMGSPSFMPPEQALGDRGKMGPASDVYSLGAILYHSLTGRPPFVGQSVADTLHQVETKEPIAPRLLVPSVPVDLETICLKCLEKEPGRRYVTAAELSEDLGCWLQLKPIRARPMSTPARTVRWARRNPVGTALIASLAMALLVSIFLLKVVNEARKSEREAVNVISVRLRRNITELWKRQDKVSEMISSEELAALMGKHKSTPPTNEVRLRIGVSSTEGPIAQAEKYQLGLDLLEREMERLLHLPVRLDLELFKSRQAIESLIAGKVDVVRTGALTYSQARRRNDGLTPLLAVNVTKDAVIFVRAGLGVTKLAQLRGHSFAFGDTSATLSLRAKVLLARAGVHAQELSRFAHLNSQAPQNDADPANFDVESRQGLSSHSEAIRAVLAGEYDAAVSRVRHIQQYLNHELIPLHFFESDPNLWVARKGLPLEHAAALRAAALSLRPDEIQALEGAWRSGFTEVSQPRLRELEAMQQSAETLFHRSQPTPAASKEIAP